LGTLDRASGTVANLKPIAALILKENGIIPRPLKITRPFHLPSACLGDEASQRVYLGGTLSPECDSAFVGCVLRSLSHAEKFRGHSFRLGGFELQPTFDLNSAAES
jgi:hypothetical protein